jgi:hypothetical protein
VAFLRKWHGLPIPALTAAHTVRGGVTVGIGFSIFLFVIGAILTFWSRRRTMVGDAVVEERRIERDLP